MYIYVCVYLYIRMTAFRDTVSELSSTTKFVYFGTPTGTYAQASERCRSVGMDLAHLTAATQGATIKFSGSGPYVGLNDLAQKLRWVNQLGGNPSNAVWGSGEPNNAGNNEDCGVLSGSKLNDIPCGDGRPTLCSSESWHGR